MSRKKNKDTKKKREEYIYATTTGDISELIVTTNSLTGEISFGSDMTNIFSERSYERAKGPKVLSRIPLAQDHITFDTDEVLKRKYDYICAVDTNTKIINGKTHSVVGIMSTEPVTIFDKDGLKNGWKHDCPLSLEYVELKREKPENFGWLAALENLQKYKKVYPNMRIGMIVDSDLGNIKDYNERKKPVDGPDFLPENVQLIYASSDAGKESMVNILLAAADSAASQILDAVEAGKLKPITNKEENPYFESLRVIIPNATFKDIQ